MSTTPQTFRALYDRLSGKLRHFILQRVSDEDITEDILQDVFIKVHANIDSLKDISKLDSWIYQITRNAIIDYYRTKKKGEPLPENIAEESSPVTINTDKLNQSVREFITKLPDVYREALLLTEYQGLTQKELAEKLGITLPGAKSRVQRAKKKLKEMLFDCCHFEFDKYGTVLDYYPHSRSCCPTCEKQEAS